MIASPLTFFGAAARLLYGALLNALVARATWRLLGRIPETRTLAAGRLERIVAASVLAASLIVVVVTIGGIAGLLNRPLGILAVTAVVALAVEIVPRGGRDWGKAPGRSPGERPARLTGDLRWTWIAAILVVSTWLPLLCERILLPPVAWDALTYHLRFPQIWLQTGHLVTAAAAIGDPSHTYYPLCGEMLLYWGILTTGTDLWSALSQVPFAVVSMCAIASLALRCGAGAGAAWLAALCWVSTPTVLRQSVEPMIDIELTACLLAAVLFATRWREVGGRSWFYLIAASVGLLIGVKFAGLLFAAILLPFFVSSWRASRRLGEPRLHAYDLFVGLAIVAAVGGFAYARNLFSGGNPLLPIRVAIGRWTVFPGPLAPEYYFGASAPRAGWGEFLLSRRSLLEMGPSFLPLLGLLPVALMQAARKRVDRGILAAWLAAIAILLLVVGGQALPFREHRYFDPVVALAWVVAAALASRFGQTKMLSRPVAGLLIALLLIQAPISLAYWGKDLVLVGPNRSHVVAALAGLGLVAALAFHSALRSLATRVGRAIAKPRAVLILVLATSLACLSGITVAYERGRFGSWLEYWSTRHEWEDRREARADDRDMAASWIYLANKTRLTPGPIAYSGLNIPYPLTGYGLRNRVLFVPRNKRMGDSWYAWGSRPPDPLLGGDPEVWSWNVSRLGIRYLCVYRRSFPRDRPASFPIEATWADRAPRQFRPIWTRDYARIYEVLARPRME